MPNIKLNDVAQKNIANIASIDSSAEECGEVPHSLDSPNAAATDSTAPAEPASDPKTPDVETPRVPDIEIDPKSAPMVSAARTLASILLPPSFGGMGIAYDDALPRWGRPENNNWFRVYDLLGFDVLTFKAQDETVYIADPSNAPLVNFLASRSASRPRRVYPYIYTDWRLGFWPVALDGTNGRVLDDYNKSAHIIAEAAKTSWRAIIPGKGSYKSATAPNDAIYGAPQWPDDMKAEFHRVANGVLVQDINHPEIMRRRGLQ